MAYVIAIIFSRGLNGLKEDPATGEWEELSLCLGDDELCPGALAGQDIATFITSTGEDEGGELYITGMSTLSLSMLQLEWSISL